MQFPLATNDKAAAVNRPAADLYLTMAKAMGAANVDLPGQTGVLSRGAGVKRGRSHSGALLALAPPARAPAADNPTGRQSSGNGHGGTPGSGTGGRRHPGTGAGPRAARHGDGRHRGARTSRSPVRRPTRGSPSCAC